MRIMFREVLPVAVEKKKARGRALKLDSGELDFAIVEGGRKEESPR